MFTGGGKQRWFPVGVHAGLHAFLRVFARFCYKTYVCSQVLPQRCFQGDVLKRLKVYAFGSCPKEVSKATFVRVCVCVKPCF